MIVSLAQQIEGIAAIGQAEAAALEKNLNEIRKRIEKLEDKGKGG